MSNCIAPDEFPMRVRIHDYEAIKAPGVWVDRLIYTVLMLAWSESNSGFMALIQDHDDQLQNVSVRHLSVVRT